MVLKSRQRLWHKIALSWLTLAFLLIITILLTRSVISMYQKNARASEKAQSARIDLAKVEERKESLEQGLGHIKTTRGVEEELRRKFDVARNGEHLLVIVDKEVEAVIPTEKNSWISSVWRKFTE